MSLNEPAIKELAQKAKQPTTIDYSVQIKHHPIQNDRLSSQCSSLTADSEQSPVRADVRVKRAAK